MTNSVELAPVVDDIITDMRDYDVRELNSNQLTAYCSVKAESFEEKAIVFNAANSPKYKVADFINKKIMVKDIYAETLELVNEHTGELNSAPRIVLIDVENEAYECVSVGMYSALKKLIATFGEPTWKDGIPCVIQQEKVTNGSMLTIIVKP